MKRRLGFFALIATLILPISVSAKTIETDTILSEDVKDGILIKAGSNVTLDLGGKNITNELGKDTIKIEKDASLTIVGNGNVTNDSHGTAVIANDGTLIVKGGTFSRVETAKAKYYVLINHGKATIYSGLFKISSNGINPSSTSSLIDNGWYSPEKNVDKTLSELTINGGTFLIEKNTKYIKNDDFGVITINDGMFTMYEPSSAVIGNMGFYSGKESVTINGGTFNYTGNNFAIWDYDWKTNGGYNDNSKTVINGGTFNISNADAKITNIQMPEKVKEFETITGEIVVGKEEDIKERLDVDQVKETEIIAQDLKLIKDAVGAKYTIASFYEIDLLKVLNENSIISQVTETAKPIKLTVKIPSTINPVANGYTRTYYVIRVHNGEADILNTNLNSDGTISFETNKFSTYSLVYEDTKVEESIKNPNTSDNVGLYFVLALVGFALVGTTARSLIKHH